MLSPRITYCVLLAGTCAWCAGFIAAPLLSGVTRELIHEFYRPVCHQMDVRSFHLAGEPFAVCSRCSAIYLSFLFAVIVYPLLRSIERPVIPPKLILLCASLPMVLDAFGGILGVHTVTLETRLITGSIFGFVLAFFIVPIIIQGLGDSSEHSIIHHPIQKGFSDARKTA